MEDITVKKVEGEATLVTYAKKRIGKNLNLLCLFSGATGSGKTYGGLRYAEDLDPDFDPSKQVTFDFRETMDLINDPWFKDKEIKVILWDEPQISISSRGWQGELNRLVNYLLSTFRHQNIILIWCSPYKTFLDSQSRKLLHLEFKADRIDHIAKKSRFFPRLLQYNDDLDKFFTKRVVRIDDNGYMPLDYWDIPMPSAKTIQVYEKKKSAFTNGLNKSILARLKKGKKPHSAKDTEGDEINPDDLTQEGF